ncbi:discoidin domain-containing protein [Marinilabiliaceae bacterium ANBcel2]|nr:discoidin domain-containing protein [Marinilabiliaceae bacterium ANBcel2]
MKKILALFITGCMLFVGACSDDDDITYPAPSMVDNIKVEPAVGGAVVTWDVPADSNYFYLEARFPKGPESDRTVRVNASVYSDSMFIDNLLNRYEYEFEIQTFNEAVQGNPQVYKTEKVRPIRRATDVTYDPNTTEDIELTEDMIDTFTQESSEGPKSALLDGNFATYWHSAWSSGVAPLPHWIEVTFEELQAVGGLRYAHRSGSQDGGKPSQWDIQISEDGNEWETVWTSDEDLSLSEETMHSLNFGRNYESKHFRFRIIDNPGGNNWTYLSRFEIFEMDARVVDLEELAEESYYN